MLLSIFFLVVFFFFETIVDYGPHPSGWLKPSDRPNQDDLFKEMDLESDSETMRKDPTLQFSIKPSSKKSSRKGSSSRPGSRPGSSLSGLIGDNKMEGTTDPTQQLFENSSSDTMKEEEKKLIQAQAQEFLPLPQKSNFLILNDLQRRLQSNTHSTNETKETDSERMDGVQQSLNLLRTWFNSLSHTSKIANSYYILNTFKPNSFTVVLECKPGVVRQKDIATTGKSAGLYDVYGRELGAVDTCEHANNLFKPLRDQKLGKSKKRRCEQM